MHRSQSALEYMMTYGWAILIIVIVAGVLYSFGIFNPSASSGTTITGFSGLGSVTAQCYANGVLRIQLGNNLGNTVNITKITATDSSNGKVTSFSGNSTVDPNPEIAPNSLYIFSLLDICPSAGSRFSISVNVNYTEPGQTFPGPYFSSGTASGTVSSTALPAFVAEFSAPYNVSATGANDNSYMTYTLPSSTNLANVNNFTFTLIGWVQMPKENGPGNTGQWMADGIFDFNPGPNGRYAAFIFTPPQSQEVIHTCDNDIHSPQISPTDPFNNQWYFFAASVNETDALFEINGNQYVVGDSSNFRSSSGVIIVGASLYCGDFGLIGDLTNLQLYNSSLSEGQLSAIYSAGVTGSQTYKSGGLVAWWPLNGTLSDFSGHSFNLVDMGAKFTSNYLSNGIS